MTFVRDAYGNVLGGARSPQVDSPVAALTGQSGGGPSFCFLFGTTAPFSAAQLINLYPSHSQFVSAWTRAVRRDVASGFIVRSDGAELVHSAAVSPIGR